MSGCGESGRKATTETTVGQILDMLPGTRECQDNLFHLSGTYLTSVDPWSEIDKSVLDYYGPLVRLHCEQHWKLAEDLYFRRGLVHAAF